MRMCLPMKMVQTMEPVFIMAQKFPMYSITYKMIRQHRNLQTRSARHGLTLPKPEYHPQTYDNEKGATMILDEMSTLVYGHDRELMKLLEDYSVGE